MFQDCRGVNDIEGLIAKREREAVGAHEPDSGVQFFEERTIVDTGRNELGAVWVPLLEIIR